MDYSSLGKFTIKYFHMKFFCIKIFLFSMAADTDLFINKLFQGQSFVVLLTEL